MVGRDNEKSLVLGTLLNKNPARIVILGAGGMGKTTLALSTLHEPAVVEHFPSRYFVSCEAVTSASALVGEIANTLRIPPAKRDEHLIDMILFHPNALLCLDDLDTIWDNVAARSDVLVGFSLSPQSYRSCYHCHHARHATSFEHLLVESFYFHLWKN
jgi:predicted ATPase